VGKIFGLASVKEKTLREKGDGWGGPVSSVPHSERKGSLPLDIHPWILVWKTSIKGASMGTTKTILLVEDNRALRALVRKSLESNGYNVLSAEDSVNANEQTKRRWGIVDLILADINLPGLTGGEYADYLKAINPDLKIIYMSGAPVTDKAVQQHLRNNSATFLAKPFTLEEMNLAIERALQ
jgi:CheY-like chemotaxis protein